VLRQSSMTISRHVQLAPHETDMQAQVEQLIGVGEWHVDLGHLTLNPVQLAVGPRYDLVIGAVKDTLLDGTQVAVPAVDARAYTPTVGRRKDLEQRQQKGQ